MLSGAGAQAASRRSSGLPVSTADEAKRQLDSEMESQAVALQARYMKRLLEEAKRECRTGGGRRRVPIQR